MKFQQPALFHLQCKVLNPADVSLKDEGKQKLLLSNPLSASGKEDFLYSLLGRGTINDLSKQYYKGI